MFGIPCRHAIRVFNYKKLDPKTEIHWWYSKEAFQLVYQHKLQPVRDEKFWKVESHHARDPPPLVKMVGRPKVKRTREKEKAINRQGTWAASRKSLKMHCGYCGK